jgi:hypothetical protein
MDETSHDTMMESIDPDHTESTVTSTSNYCDGSGGDKIHEEPLSDMMKVTESHPINTNHIHRSSSSNTNSTGITAAAAEPVAAILPKSPAISPEHRNIIASRNQSGSFDVPPLPTSSPVLEVIKRLQEPSPPSTIKSRVYDIPTLEVPVKEKAYDYETGKLLVSSTHSKQTMQLTEEIMTMVEEGMVMKKVEHVELTEQQLLRKQLAIAAAAVANRRMAEELARRTAMQQMEAAIEQQAALVEAQEEQERQRRLQEEEEDAVAAMQQELLLQKRRKQKEQEELELIRQRKNEAKQKAAALEQQQELEQEQQRQQKTAAAAAELEIQNEIRQRIEDAKAKAKEAARAHLQNQEMGDVVLTPPLEQQYTEKDYRDMESTFPTVTVDMASTSHTSMTTSIGKYDDTAISMNGSITSKRSTYSGNNNHNHDVILEEDEDDHDEDDEDDEKEREEEEENNDAVEETEESKYDDKVEQDGHESSNVLETISSREKVGDNLEDIANGETNINSILHISTETQIIKNNGSDHVEEVVPEKQPIIDHTHELSLSSKTSIIVDDNDVANSTNVDDTPLPVATQDMDDDEEYEEEEIEEEENIAPVHSNDVRNDDVPSSIAPTTAQRSKPEPIITSLPTPVSVQQYPTLNHDDDNFIEEEINVEDNEPFHHLPSSMMPQHQKPPQTVIANHNFDQRNNIPDDVSNFSNDDSSLLHHHQQQQQQQFTTSSLTAPNQLFHKSSNLSTATTSGGSSTTSQNNNTSSSISPRRSISDIIRHDLWNPNEMIVEQALQQLVEKASIHNSYRNAIARAGGILAIIRAMEQHINHVGIQIASCMALEKLAIDTENELAIGEVGGIEQILGAMMAHYTNGKVQEAAWSALWNCTCGNACDTMTIDTTPGGMTAVISCMKQHVDNVAVQISACNTIMNLCYDNNERIQLLMEADGFGAIVQAIQTHCQNEAAKNEMSYILCSLLEKNVKKHYILQQQQQKQHERNNNEVNNRSDDDDELEEEYEEEVLDEEGL